MSKEKQCKCCHEWWYGSDVKEDLCPNCYDYFKQLKRQLEEKDKEIERLKQELEETNAGYDFTYEQSGATIKELKQNQTQLAIQELAEIERLLYESHYKEIDNKYYAEYEDINSLIDSRIKVLEELKGEKNDNR